MLMQMAQQSGIDLVSYVSQLRVSKVSSQLAPRDGRCTPAVFAPCHALPNASLPYHHVAAQHPTCNGVPRIQAF